MPASTPIKLGNCKKCGPTIKFRAKDTKMGFRWRCRKCQRNTGKERRRRIKAQLVAEHGGACEKCGYKKCIGALHFHHRDRELKEHHVSSRSLESARIEAAKCDLLCANCHYELEWNGE